MRKPTGFFLVILAGLILLPSNSMGQTPRTATATATVVNGFVVSITVTDGGFGYTTAPTVRLSSTTGSGAVAVATIANGAVDKIVVMEVGSGYGPNPMVVISEPPWSRTATATASIVNGFLVGITITDGGFGYTTAPTVRINGGAGAGAEVRASISNGAVTEIAVENTGKGYASSTEVTISPPGTAAAPFSEGLVAFYPLSSNANDESGNDNDGILLDVTAAADRYSASGKSLFFPGNGYVLIPNTPSLEALDLLTVSAWIRHDGIAAGASGMSIVSKVSDDGTALAWNLGITPAGMLQLCANVGGWSYFDCQTVLEPGVWHHVAMVYDGSQLKGFVDGHLDGSGGMKGPLARSNRPVRIGVYSPTASPQSSMFFTGQIDDVRIYNRALSTDELNDLYHYEAPEGPWVSMSVKTVQVTLHVKPNKKYQLQASLDVVNWTNVGEPFIALASEVVREFDAVDVGRYFRVNELKN